MKPLNIKFLFNSIVVFMMILTSLPTLAEEKFVFATHTPPPLSLYLQEVIQEALKPYSTKVQTIEMPGNRVISQVNSGRIDGDLSRVVNFKEISDIDSSNYLLVNEPLVLIEIVMITLANKNIEQPITWTTVNQGSVAFLRGSKTIRNNLNPENRIAVSSNTNVLKMVANKRVDSAIMFSSVANSLLEQLPELRNKLVIHKPAVDSFHLFTYLNKKHAELIPKLELSLKQLKNNGFMENTAKKYQVATANTEKLSVVN